MRLLKATIPALVAVAAAMLWGSLTALTGSEFGAAAWLAGAMIGPAVAHASSNRSGVSFWCAACAGVSLSLAKFWFVFCPWGVAKPPLVEAFRAIDLLWFAMAWSAAQWVAAACSRRSAQPRRAEARLPAVGPPVRAVRPSRPGERRPSPSVRWSQPDRSAARSEDKRAP
ncbi:MAG: hypothetical protein IT438_13315 [Phycisphaerales bacterium]|nr:hypothetical protein [Phycisphaerales bacterium]